MIKIKVLKTLSEREFGSIFLATVIDGPGLSQGEQLRVRAQTSAMLGRPSAGEIWVVDGSMRPSPWGRQLEVSSARRTLPSGKLITDFLAANARGLGPIRAERLWTEYGAELSEVLSDPGRVAEIARIVSPDRLHLGATIAAQLIELWRDTASQTKLVEWLSDRGITDIALVNRVARLLGFDAIEHLARNPYLLVPLLPWRKVDALGLRLIAEEGEEPFQDPRRLLGAVDAAIKDVIAAGNTAIDASQLPVAIAEKLKLSPSSRRVARAINIGAQNHAITATPAFWRAPGCAAMEDNISRRLRELERAQPSLPLSTRMVSDSLGGLDSALHEEQLRAVFEILGRPVACLQGGAGVGKTYTTRAICDAWERLGGHLILCALAGKAALRLTRATGRLARTIARLLGELDRRQKLDVEVAAGLKGSVVEGGIDELPSITAETLVIVDEASMVDLPSLHALVRHMPDGARLLLVGDEAQLPPVGMGLIFHKLVTDESITSRLTQVHRQAAETGIPDVAASIRARLVPPFRKFEGLGSGVSFVEAEPTSIVNSVVTMHRDFALAGAEAVIVCPTRSGPAGVQELNERIHAEHMVEDAPQVRGHFGNLFAVGEPVVYLRNRYDLGLFNGLLGSVLSVDPERRSVVVQFDGYDKSHEILRDDLIDLSLAYAITCHKVQGSQAERTIIPVYPSKVLDPSWLYTAVTRASLQAVIVGSRKVFDEALFRTSASERRLVGFVW